MFLAAGHGRRRPWRLTLEVASRNLSAIRPGFRGHPQPGYGAGAEGTTQRKMGKARCGHGRAHCCRNKNKSEAADDAMGGEDPDT